MNYNFELKIDDVNIDGTIDIDGYKYQIWFDYNDILFEAKSLSQGEGSILFKMFSGNITYSLSLELEEEGYYIGEFREVEKVIKKPSKIILSKEIELRFI